MFRKPKQSAKNRAAMRKRTVRNNDDDDDDNDDDRRNRHKDDGSSNKRSTKSYRVKSNDSDGESTSSNEGAVGTRDLLEQIRREKMGPSGGGKKRRLTDTSLNNDHHDDKESGQKNKQGDVMHKFESSSAGHGLSASDMATRTAEYHPTNVTKGSTSTSTSTGREGGPTDTAGIDNTEKGEGKKNKIYQGQNKTRNPYHAGPLKAPTFVRTTCRFDYQPDICKDYKDTGFCGFGDTCIYLHDRGDTLTGWQLERQWEEQKKKEREEKEREMDKFIKVVSSSTGENALGGKDLDEDKDGKTMTDDGLPFACHICRNPFIDPVITSCGHYFCEKCIMGRVRGESLSTGSACPICGKDTHGVFNHPTKLLAKKRRLVGSEGTWEEFADAARGKK